MQLSSDNGNYAYSAKVLPIEVYTNKGSFMLTIVVK